MRCERVTIDDTPRAHREDRKGARAEGRAAVLRLGSIVPPTITTKGIFRAHNGHHRHRPAIKDRDSISNKSFVRDEKILRRSGAVLAISLTGKFLDEFP